MKRKLYLVLTVLGLILLITGVVYRIVTPPTVDFVLYCTYGDGYSVNAHRDFCPKRESNLISWKIFGQVSEWESTWSAYLAPSSAGSPYFFWDYGDDSHLEYLMKKALGN